MSLFDPRLFFQEMAHHARTPLVLFLVILLIATVIARAIFNQRTSTPAATPSRRPAERSTGRQSQPSIKDIETETVSAPSVFLMKMRTYEAKHLWVRVTHLENGANGRRIPTFELIFSSGRFTVVMPYRYVESNLLTVGGDMKIRQLIEIAAQSTGKSPVQIAKGSKICVSWPLEKLAQLPQTATA